MNDSSDCDAIDELLSGHIDGELTQGARQRVDVHVDGCARCAARLDELKAVRASVGALPIGELDQETWRKMMNDATARTTRGIGWLLLIGGGIAVLGFAIYEFLLAETDAPLLKWGLIAFYVGLGVLLLAVIRQRMLARKTDRYKDVEI